MVFSVRRKALNIGTIGVDLKKLIRQTWDAQLGIQELTLAVMR